MTDYGPTRNDAHSILRWVLFGFLLVLVLAGLFFIYSWVNKPLEVLSPDNIQRLSQEANDKWQALLSQQATIDTISQRAKDMVVTYGEDRSVWPQGKSDEYLQLRQQVGNQITAFNLSCGQYNALWQDEWRSIPAPDDLPKKCELYTE